LKDTGVRASDSGGDLSRRCRHGDRGRLLGFERVASHPTAADARAYFDSWVEFYQDFYHYPRTSRSTSSTGSTATR
jgi:hypothetical protein